jgi:hypothetical protein
MGGGTAPGEISAIILREMKRIAEANLVKKSPAR